VTIRGHPLRFPPVYKNGRAAFLSRFPYQVTYTADDEEIIIVACTHHARDPEVWMKRLR
jgi:plasmid stabilization system protein ParE